MQGSFFGRGRHLPELSIQVRKASYRLRRAGHAAENMVPERAGHAKATRLPGAVMQRMPALTAFQPGMVGTPMVGSMVRDGVGQIAGHPPDVRAQTLHRPPKARIGRNTSEPIKVALTTIGVHISAVGR